MSTHQINPDLAALFDAIEQKASPAKIAALSSKAKSTIFATLVGNDALASSIAPGAPINPSWPERHHQANTPFPPAGSGSSVAANPKAAHNIPAAPPGKAKNKAAPAAQAAAPKSDKSKTAAIFPMLGDGHHVRIEQDMHAYYDRTGEGVMYALDIIFSREFFSLPPDEAWTPEHVAFKAIGFDAGSLHYLSSFASSPKTWEKAALTSWMQEPENMFERLGGAGALTQAQNAWLDLHGYYDPIQSGSAAALFAKHFKRKGCKIAPVH